MAKHKSNPRNNSRYRTWMSLERWLDREAEKREIEERTLPINEMDDIIPIYDTDGMPFEEDCVFNDVSGMTASPSEATIEKSLPYRNSRFAGMPPLTISEGTLRMALRYDILDYPKDYETEDYFEDSLDDLIDAEESRLETMAEQEKNQTVQPKREDYKTHRKENFNKRKELFSDQKPNWRFRTKPISDHNFDAYAFELVNLLKQFYGVKENQVNKGYLAHKVRQNKKPIHPDLASYVLALETVGKQQWIKKCLPYKTYETIMAQCKKSYNKSFNSYKEKYKTEYEEGKKSMTQERYLELKYEDLKGRKVKLPEKYL